MKNATQAVLESGRPSGQPVELIDFCLKALYNDTDHTINQEIVKHFTFEELIGALLVARDTIQDQAGQIEELEEKYSELLDRLDNTEE